MSAWNRWVCPCCQTERDASLRVRLGYNKVRCRLCVDRRVAAKFASKAKAGRKPSALIYDEDFAVPVESHVPASVMDAYAEALE